MLKDIVAVWQTKSDLTKLQYAYCAVIVVTLVAGGLAGLLNQNVAWQILSLTWIVTVTFFVNFVSFALIHLYVTPKQPVKPARRAQTIKRR